MTLDDNNPAALCLSSQAARRVNWGEIRKHAVGFRTLGRARSETATPAPQASREMIENVFQAAKIEFAASVAGLRRLVQALLLCLGLAVVMVSVGVLLAAAYLYIVGGTTLSVAAVASLILIVRQLLRLGRDQVMLETYLLRYRIALQLANSPEAYGKILERFLDETSLAENLGITGRRVPRKTT
jgi:hypothetical protein